MPKISIDFSVQGMLSSMQILIVLHHVISSLTFSLQLHAFCVFEYITKLSQYFAFHKNS